MPLKPVRRVGFTLLEVLIVLVILSVLAGLAIPMYGANVERARTSEALHHLEVTRRAMMRYYFSNNYSYLGATIPLASQGTVDYNPNIEMGGQNNIFAYDFSSGPNAQDFELRATRIAGGGCVIPPVGSIRVDEAGNITRTGVYL